MAEQDFYLKKLLENKERFADFINVNVFDGNRVLQAKDLHLLPNESGIVVIGSDGMKRTIQRRRDVVMNANLGVCFCIVASENQSNVHYAMAVREMMYDALDYTEQVQRVEEAHRQAGDKLEGADFLSHFTKEDRIVPVLTLTLYYGSESWDGPRSLYGMMGLDDNQEVGRYLKNILPDYRINLIDIRDAAVLEKYETSLQFIFGMVRYNKNKQLLYSYTHKHKDEINHMDRDSKAAALSLLGEQKRLMKILETHTEKEEFDMCQAIDELIADGEKRGELTGLEKAKIYFIRNQYKKQLSAAQTAELLGLDQSYVEKVIRSFQLYPDYSDDKIASLLLS